MRICDLPECDQLLIRRENEAESKWLERKYCCRSHAQRASALKQHAEGRFKSKKKKPRCEKRQRLPKGVTGVHYQHKPKKITIKRVHLDAFDLWNMRRI